MKRFYKTATVEERADGFAILLDGRAVKTPARAAFVLPGRALAEAVAAEWNAQGEAIEPAAMTMTGFANAAIDQVLPDVSGFAAGIAAYGANDLFCYRAADPAELAALQADQWDPLLDWARGRYAVAFEVTDGIMPVNQPPATVAKMGSAVTGLDPWLLSGFSVLVTLGGSLVGALALVEGIIDAGGLWDAAHVDEHWQARMWGEDAEAAARLEARRAQFHDAARYCVLVMRDAAS